MKNNNINNSVSEASDNSANVKNLYSEIMEERMFEVYCLDFILDSLLHIYFNYTDYLLLDPHYSEDLGTVNELGALQAVIHGIRAGKQ